LSYCDPSTGVCLPGCVGDVQCTGANEICDVPSHACVCDIGFDRCDLECVDTLTDERYCGDCGTVCGSGEICEAGVCLDPTDCRTNGVGCSGLSYCDPSTGACVRCLNDTQCGATNEVCDTNINDCVCRSGFERCPPIFGFCVDTLTDERYCGDCGTACGSGEFCLFGECLGGD
jgi:hypothetical protein